MAAGGSRAERDTLRGVLHESDRRARRVALNVSGAALLLAAAKAAVGFAAGSIAVLSSALDSAGDVLASAKAGYEPRQLDLG